MREQFQAVLGVLLRPKATMQALPTARVYVLAILAPMYFGIARAFRPRYHALLVEKLGGNWQIVVAVSILALVMIPVGAWLWRQFLKLFKKRLSVRKLMNINGYSHVPRLLVAAIGYVLMWLNPSMFASEQPTPGLVAIIALGCLGIAYTLYLYIYGIVVSPSEERDAANNEPEDAGRSLAGAQQ